MSSPNLIANRSPLSGDPLMAFRPMSIPGIYESGRNEKDGPCDWNDPETGAAFSMSDDGTPFSGAETGADWQNSESGPDWQASESGQSWKNDKDCT